MTETTPRQATLFGRIFLPFAFAYFLSYIFRGVNAVIFPYLERDIGITAADLGLLTSAFFLFFALVQIVLGVGLDRYGPRKMQVMLLAVAALGSALFGLSQSFGGLIVARVLIGFGFASGLTAAIKIFTLWYPRSQWGVVTGFYMMTGGAGSMAATVPVQWSLSVVSWQGLFFWLAAACLAASIAIQLVVPEKPAARATGSLAEQFRVMGAVLTDGYYWRLQPLFAAQQLALIGCSTLWIGPWLRDVGAVATEADRASIQLYAMTAMAAGFAASGLLIGWCRRIGIGDFAFSSITSLLFVLVIGWIAWGPLTNPTLIWSLFGFLGACPIQYMPLMVAAFPNDYAGRVTAASNLMVFLVIFAGQWMMGKVVDLWPRTAIGYAPDGYGWAFGALFILQSAALAWALLSRGRPMAQESLSAAG
jgi:MFS family permease